MVLDNIVSSDTNMQLPRTLDSRKSYKQLILFEMKIRQITHLILLSGKKRKKDLTEQIHTINLEFTCDRLHNSTNRNPKETTEINQDLQRKGKCSIELTALWDSRNFYSVSNHQLTDLLYQLLKCYI